MEGRASKAMKWAVFWLLMVCGALAGIYCYSAAVTPASDNYCAMTYMRPSYFEVLTESEWSSKYRLFLYREESVAQRFWKERGGRLQGIPVLFIPGNGGFYEQVRSLASFSAKQSLGEGGQFSNEGKEVEFDFFSLDQREELSAASHQLLDEQTEFANDCIATILGLYEGSDVEGVRERPTSVILVGHSMGGVVARRLFMSKNYSEGSVSTILTLNTPHRSHAIYYQKELMDLYREMNAYWAKGLKPGGDMEDVLLISLAGSFRDTLIDSALSDLSGLVPYQNGFSCLTPSFPHVWREADHQCILWCNQLVRVVSSALFRLADPSTGQNTLSLPWRRAAFEGKFFSELPTILGLRDVAGPEAGVDPKLLKRWKEMHRSSPPLAVAEAPPSPLGVRAADIPSVDSLADGPQAVFKFGPTTALPLQVYRFDVKQWLREGKDMLVLMTDLEVTDFSIHLCKTETETPQCSENVALLLGARLPSHEDFVPYKSGKRKRELTTVLVGSVESLFRLKREVLGEYDMVVWKRRKGAVPRLLAAEMTTESEGSRDVIVGEWLGVERNVPDIITDSSEPRGSLETGGEEENTPWEENIRGLFGRDVAISGERGFVSSFSLPLHNKFLVFKASLFTEDCLWERQRFLPLAVQYRPRMQEQHIHTNATEFSLRFHHSSSEDHHLVLLTDPGCDYTLRLELDVKGMVAQYAHAYISTFVSLPLCIVLLVAARQFRSSHRGAEPSSPPVLPSAMTTIRVTLFRLLPVILVIIPIIEVFFYDSMRSIVRSAVETLPEPFGAHSFSDHVQATPPVLAICLLALLALPLVAVIQSASDVGIHFLSITLTWLLSEATRVRLHRGLTGYFRIMVGVALVALAVQTHGLPSLLLAMGYLILSCATLKSLDSDTEEERERLRALGHTWVAAQGRVRCQKLVLMLCYWLAIERVVSFIVWVKAFEAGQRLDDTSTLLMLLPIVACLVVVSSPVRQRTVAWAGCVSATWYMLFYALVPFYRSHYAVCYVLAALIASTLGFSSSTPKQKKE